MTILMTGATGRIGSAAVNRLLAVGAPVRVLSRRPHRVHEQFGDRVEMFEWHPMTEDAPAPAFDGITVVINLMGEPIAGRWNKAKRQRIRESRVVATQKLSRALEGRRLRFLSASTCGIYPGRRGELYTEKSELPRPQGFVRTMANEWEAAALSARGPSVTVLRIGMVTGPGAYPSRLVELFARGRGIVPGDGDQVVPIIHIDDLTLMIVWAAGHPEITGPINCVAPRGVRLGDVVSRIESATGQPARLKVPSWLVRAYLGGRADFMLNSYDVRPAIAAASGFEFMYPDGEDALAWALAGTVPEGSDRGAGDAQSARAGSGADVTGQPGEAPADHKG